MWSRSLPEKLTVPQLLQKFPRILWSPNVHYRIYKSQPPVPILSQTSQSMLAHTTSPKSILILSSHLRLRLPSDILPSGFRTRTLYAPLISPIRAACPAHTTLLHLITRIKLVRSREHKASCYVVFSTAVTSSLLGPNFLLSTLFWKTLSLRPPSV